MTEPIWQEWRPFPDSNSGDYLVAPFGAGVYWLRDSRTGADIYIGEGGHVAERMSSLLPAPLGCGTRNNSTLRDYLQKNLGNIEYRTIACASKAEAKALEKRLHQSNPCRFS